MSVRIDGMHDPGATVLMDRVSQAEVIRHWLRIEREKPTVDSFDVDSLGDDEALDTLLDVNPGSAAFVWRDAPIDWYHVELPRRTFLNLHVVRGPEHLRWRALSPDNTIQGAAERIDRGDPDELAATTGVDIETALSLREAMPEAAADELVLATRQGCVPWTVADGNHRAVAKALSLLEGDPYEPQRAYLGVGRNPVVSSIGERVCGLLRRVRSRAWGPVAPTRIR